MNEEKNRHRTRTTNHADAAPETAPDRGTEAQAAGSEELQGKIAELQKAADTLKDQLLRKAADFENFRKRVEGEYATVIRNANESLFLSLLPTIDDLVRSLKSGKEKKDFDSFYRGVELIYGKFTRTLEDEGLVAFESVGKPFDVQYHDALLQVPREDVPPHTVVEEVERGFMLNGRVLRHAKVVVSSAPGPHNGDAKETDA